MRDGVVLSKLPEFLSSGGRLACSTLSSIETATIETATWDIARVNELRRAEVGLLSVVAV